MFKINDMVSWQGRTFYVYSVSGNTIGLSRMLNGHCYREVNVSELTKADGWGTR